VGNAHLCLQTDDIDADYARMRGGGYDDFRTPHPMEIPWGPNKGRRVCYLRDPDGISIELLEVLTGRPEPRV
jgi:catechol 2,3-dioxygenase-like lactoylglutathione lyase family enzyme